MQFNSNGIPCNVPQGFNPRKKVQVVKKLKETPNPYKHYAELTRNIDGQEQTVIGPVGTKEYRKALKDGYEIAHEWMVS